MIGNNLSPHHGRRFHMDAAGPSLAAITRVHLKNKDIQSAIGRKFNGNPNDTTTFITALDTLLDRTDLGPYARGTVSVLVSQYHTAHGGFPQPQPQPRTLDGHPRVYLRTWQSTEPVFSIVHIGASIVRI